MAASGFTPISLYYSTTASAVPTSGNLANGELGLNIADMKLYAKNSAGTVTLLASNAGASGSVTSVSGTGTVNGLTLTGTVTTSGSLTLGGTLSGTASININGTVGATTPTTGAFTTIRSSTGSSSAIFGGGSSSNEVVTITAQTGGLGIGLGIQNSSSNLSGISFPTNASATTSYTYITADGRSGASGFIKSYVNDAVVSNLTSTGLAVSGTLSATGNLTSPTAQFGTNPAGVSIGVIGIPNQKRIYGRNTTNTGDINILFVDGNNNVVIGPNDNATFTQTSMGIGTASPATTVHAVATGGAIRIQDNIGTAKYIQMRSDVTNSHLEHVGGPGDALRINNQAAGTIEFYTSNTQRFNIGASGQFGIGGATYGTAGQVLTSGGASAAPTWAAAGGGSQAFVAFGSTGGM